MKDKKQITIISLLGALAVGVLASAVVLGNAYNNSQALRTRRNTRQSWKAMNPKPLPPRLSLKLKRKKPRKLKQNLKPQPMRLKQKLNPRPKLKPKTRQKQMKLHLRQTRTKLRRKSSCPFLKPAHR